MDLSTAISAHAEWKTKLRSAAEKKESLNVATIAADNCCELGKWLHGEAKAKYGALPAYKECLTNHAGFHRAARRGRRQDQPGTV
jgi:methyl-accepting chemotaxis protein